MKKGQLLLFVQKLCGTLLAVSYALAALIVVKSQMVPILVLLFTLPFISVAITLLVAACFKKVLPKAKSIALILCTLLLAFFSTYTFFTGNATLNFLDSIQSKNFVYEEYNIIAKKDAHISLTDGSTHKMGLIKTDTNKDLITKAVNNKTKAAYSDYNELASLTVAINNNDVDTAVIKSSYTQLLQENYNAFYQNIEVLDTFKIKLASSANASTTDITKPFIVYISGADGDINATNRSDSNIIIAVNPQSHKILMVNTPRDYYVKLHDIGDTKDKLTHAGIYGIDTSVQTLEDLYDIDINYYLKFDFGSLVGLVDTLGGVNVYSEYNFTAGSYTFAQGYNYLDGKKALAFARERYSFEQGDRVRGMNQQRLIEAIIQKISSPDTLVNYQQILKSLEGKLLTNASTDVIANLINQQMSSLSKWQISSISVDGQGKKDYAFSTGDLEVYVMEPDQTSVDNAKDALKQYLSY